jgi:hypothetical protein
VSLTRHGIKEPCERRMRIRSKAIAQSPTAIPKGRTHAFKSASFKELAVARAQPATRATAHSINKLPFSSYLKL